MPQSTITLFSCILFFYSSGYKQQNGIEISHFNTTNQKLVVEVMIWWKSPSKQFRSNMLLQKAHADLKGYQNKYIYLPPSQCQWEYSEWSP